MFQTTDGSFDDLACEEGKLAIRNKNQLTQQEWCMALTCYSLLMAFQS